MTILKTSAEQGELLRTPRCSDQKSATSVFLLLQKEFHAAWYCESSSDPTGTASLPLLGVRVHKDLSYECAEGLFVVRRGGMLLRWADKSIEAVQPELIRTRFVRCFRDGTRICKMSEGKMAQALALSKSNTQIRKRISGGKKTGFLGFIRNILPAGKNTHHVHGWIDDIHAHVKDLTRKDDRI